MRSDDMKKHQNLKGWQRKQRNLYGASVYKESTL